MKRTSKFLSYISLALMIIFPCLVYGDLITFETNKTWMLVLTIAWFLTAPVWMLNPRED